jgi:hypothetical protein
MGAAMKKVCSTIFAVLVTITQVIAPAAAQLKPVVGLTLFGGAERGNDDHAGGIGGSELLGVLPFGERFGLQGSLLNQGGHGGYRFGLSAGPVFAYDSGKYGLFGDYVYRNRGENNFFYLRGAWSHYFDSFDFTLSYTQPVHRVQHTNFTVPVFAGGASCGRFTTVKKAEPSINELKGIVRYYPTRNLELNTGLLVNSFAGPDRNKTGTGFGGVFGAAIQVLDWLIIRPVQGQMDTRERYRITSGVEVVWAPTEVPYSRQRVQERDSAFSFASATAANVAAC